MHWSRYIMEMATSAKCIPSENRRINKSMQYERKVCFRITHIATWLVLPTVQLYTVIFTQPKYWTKLMVCRDKYNIQSHKYHLGNPTGHTQAIGELYSYIDISNIQICWGPYRMATIDCVTVQAVFILSWSETVWLTWAVPSSSARRKNKE